MSEFDPHLNIEPLVKAKDSDTYVVKEIEIEHLKIKIEAPYKIMDGKKINRELAFNLTKNVKNPIFESWAYVIDYRSFKNLHYLLEEAEEDRVTGLNNFLGIRTKLWDRSLTTASLAFGRNPFVENVFVRKSGEIEKLPPLDKGSYDVLLDHIFGVSKAMILSPDIRIRKREGMETINLDDYLKFVDYNIKILSDWNKKPIFAPIQIHLSQKNLTKVLAHYKKQGYTNIWINFNATHLGCTYIGRVRTLLRCIERIIGLTNVALYFSHIKKEVNPHIKDEKTVASDVLSQFLAADFIGVNRAPRTGGGDIEDWVKKQIEKGEFKSKDDLMKALIFHKSRIFDPDSYYYCRVDRYPHESPIDRGLLFRDEVNRLLNSTLLYNEIERTRTFVEEEKSILPYVKNKDALQENKDILGGIIKEDKTKQLGLLESLGEL